MTAPDFAGTLRRRILEALARGDGQMLDGFDLGHTAEMMYGEQADAVMLLLGKEVQHRTQAVYNESDLSKPLAELAAQVQP